VAADSDQRAEPHRVFRRRRAVAAKEHFHQCLRFIGFNACSEACK
jgi:hypothetical protein